MGNAALIAKELPSKRLKMAEIGAGDGTLALQVASNLPGGQIELVDQQPSVSEATIEQFCQRNWEVTIVEGDVFEWVQRPSSAEVIFANLFLHHFTPANLRALFSALRCSLFVACEPRRNPFAAMAARLIWMIGCNHVTRHDAVVSVRAGFRGKELSALWPPQGWDLTEKRAGLFSHLFVARKCQK